MTSVFNRLSEASATSLMCSGGLLAGDRINFEPELGGYHHLLTEGSESFAHEFFVREWTVHFSRVEERDPAFDGRPNEGDPLLLLYCWPEAKAQSHAAQSDRGYFQIAFSKFAFTHNSSCLKCALTMLLLARPVVQGVTQL
jgi:hypothetical protein